MLRRKQKTPRPTREEAPNREEEEEKTSETNSMDGYRMGNTTHHGQNKH